MLRWRREFEFKHFQLQLGEQELKTAQPDVCQGNWSYSVSMNWWEQSYDVPYKQTNKKKQFLNIAGLKLVQFSFPS